MPNEEVSYQGLGPVPPQVVLPLVPWLVNELLYLLDPLGLLGPVDLVDDIRMCRPSAKKGLV